MWSLTQVLHLYERSYHEFPFTSTCELLKSFWNSLQNIPSEVYKTTDHKSSNANLFTGVWSFLFCCWGWWLRSERIILILQIEICFLWRFFQLLQMNELKGIINQSAESHPFFTIPECFCIRLCHFDTTFESVSDKLSFERVFVAEVFFAQNLSKICEK